MLTKVKLSDYFDIKSSIQDDKINFEITNKNDDESIPFIGRSATNNGIVDYVKKRNGYINKGNVITLALDGSTGSTFYQKYEFSSGQNIWLLIPKTDKLQNFTPKIALYLVTSIRKAVKEYSYNLSLTKTRLQKIYIFLPINKDKKIDISFIENEMNTLRNIDFVDSLNKNRFVNTK
jgi:hypothetical protein